MTTLRDCEECGMDARSGLLSADRYRSQCVSDGARVDIWHGGTGGTATERLLGYSLKLRKVVLDNPHKSARPSSALL